MSNAQTKPAERTTPAGRILDLPGGDVQVTDRAAERRRRGARPIVLLHC